jgi:hypothetical protein
MLLHAKKTGYEEKKKCQTKKFREIQKRIGKVLR